MQIDKNKNYVVGKYTYQNFTTLTEEQIKQVWEWRNHPEIRRNMYNKDVIPFEHHIGYVNSLKTRDEAYYWLVFKKDKAIGVTSITSVDCKSESAELGSYLKPDLINSGLGFDFFYHNLLFLFGSEIDCSSLNAAVFRPNINALLMDCYLGFEINESDAINPTVDYIRLVCNKDSFREKHTYPRNIRALSEFVSKYKPLLIKYSQLK